MIITGYEDIVSNLGFDAQQAISEITRLSQAMERLEAVMRSTAGSIGVFNTAGAKFQGVSTNIKSLSNSQRELINVTGQVPKLMKSNFVSMESLEKQASKLGQEISKSSKNMILSWQSVLRIFTIQVAHQAIARLTGLIRDSLSAAQDYELELAAIRTINENFAGGLDATSAAISRLSSDFARPVEDIAAGFYQILSDQIENASDALLVLGESLELSRAALGTTEEAASTITGVLNAFGKQTFETSSIADVLFRTVDLGRVTLSEMANSLGRVNVLSSRLGVTFEEQQAALATITIQGIDASEAMTFLRNTFLKLLKPTETMKKAFDEIGVSSAETGIAAFGLQGFLEKLVSVSGDSATELGELFGRLRATQGALALTGENAEKFREALDRIQDSAGAAREAAEIIAGAPAERLRQAAQELRTEFVELGRDINAAFIGFIDSAGGATDLVKGLGLAIAAAGAISVVANFRAIQAAITGVGTSAGAAAVRFGLLTAAFAVAQVAVDKLTVSIAENDEEIRQGLAARAEQFDRALQGFVNARRRIIDSETQSELQAIAERTRIRQADANNAIRFAELITAQQIFNLKQQVSAARTNVNEIEKIFTDAQKRIAESQNEVLDSQFNKEQFIFERRIRNLSETRQIQEELNRARKIELQASQALQKGDEDRARTLFDEAQRQREAALSSADQLKNQSLIQRAENDIRRGFDSRIRSEKKFQEDQKTQAEKAKELIPLAQQLLVALETNSGELEKHVQLINDGKVAFETQKEAIEANASLLAKTNELAARLGVSPAITQAQLAADFQAQFSRLTEEQAKNQTAAGAAAEKELGVKILTSAQEADLIQKIKERRRLALDLQAQELKANSQLQQTFEEIEKVAGRKTFTQLTTGFLAGVFPTERFNTTEEENKKRDEAVALIKEASQSVASLNLRQEEVLQALKDANVEEGQRLRIFNQLVGAAEKLDELELQKEVNFSKGSSFDSVVKQIEDLANKEINIPVNLVQQNGTVQNQSRGGLIHHFAQGGFVPKGTDTVPAMLSPGEFVVNADSTRKFFSQLVAINRGIQPKYMAEGGPVTRVGDINITVKGGTTSGATLRNIAEGLRREFRRGSIRSF